MLNNTLQLVIDIISKPCDERTESDVAVVLPWLCKTADIFKDINKGQLGDSIFISIDIYY